MKTRVRRVEIKVKIVAYLIISAVLISLYSCHSTDERLKSNYKSNKIEPVEDTITINDRRIKPISGSPISKIRYTANSFSIEGCKNLSLHTRDYQSIKNDSVFHLEGGVDTNSIDKCCASTFIFNKRLKLTIPQNLTPLFELSDSLNMVADLNTVPIYKYLELDSLKADGILLDIENPLSIEFNNLNVKSLSIFSPRANLNEIRRPGVDFCQYGCYIDSSTKVTDRIEFEGFSDIKIGKFVVSTEQAAEFLDCTFGIGSSIEVGGSMDSLAFQSLKSDSSKANLKLRWESNSKKKLILKLYKCDFEQVDFDYSKFHFKCYDIDHYSDLNQWKSDIISEYNGIIKSQIRLNNQEGIKDASIELSIFNDQQMPAGRLISNIKLWWNDYGFDKGKVIWSSLELFVGIVILNFLFFNKLLGVYDIAGIAASREDSFKRKSKLLGPINRFLLCTLYSGFIFYGVKFEFSNLTIRKSGYVWLLLLEYVLGLISVAFIANLIITK